MTPRTLPLPPSGDESALSVPQARYSHIHTKNKDQETDPHVKSTQAKGVFNPQVNGYKYKRRKWDGKEEPLRYLKREMRSRMIVSFFRDWRADLKNADVTFTPAYLASSRSYGMSMYPALLAEILTEYPECRHVETRLISFLRPSRATREIGRHARVCKSPKLCSALSLLAQMPTGIIAREVESALAWATEHWSEDTARRQTEWARVNGAKGGRAGKRYTLEDHLATSHLSLRDAGEVLNVGKSTVERMRKEFANVNLETGEIEDAERAERDQAMEIRTGIGSSPRPPADRLEDPDASSGQGSNSCTLGSPEIRIEPVVAFTGDLPF